jgi:hypothetical protein
MRLRLLLLSWPLLACTPFGSDESADASVSEAAAPVLDGGTPVCPGTDLFADGFQRGKPGGEGWRLFGDVDPMTDASVGLPAPALVARLPAATGESRLGRTLNGLLAKICVEADVFVEADPAQFADANTSYSEIFALEPQGSNDIYFEVRRAGMTLAIKGGEARPVPFPFGRWVHVAIEASYTTPATLKLTIDGDVTVMTIPIMAPVVQADVKIGLHTQMPASATVARVDNFRITKP